MDDPYNLQRFLEAQHGVFERVLEELRAGRKRSHWMWFIFPQINGLGRSEMASFYGISGSEEATAYLEHPVLGQRLEQCVELLMQLEGPTATQIFGELDAMKLRSSLTLFATIAPAGSIFGLALEKYFAGERDPLTVAQL